MHIFRWRGNHMRKRFQVGETVQLMSGGPPMTIMECTFPVGDEGDETYVCKWFGGSTLKKATFPGTTLRAAKPEGGTLQILNTIPRPGEEE